jgi:16S rRNA (guanine527-N7)-methyltransferase
VKVDPRSFLLACLPDRLRESVSRETLGRLDHYAALVKDEARRQNLVSASTLDSLWERHIVDSAQLVRFEPFGSASWLDIGSGAGLPGLVIAILLEGPMLLVEPRKLRADFLRRAVAELGLESRVAVAQSRVEAVDGRFDVITARAVAPLDKLLQLSTHLSTRKSIWLLPKGRSAQTELADARRNWQCEAEVVPSCTDPDSEILVLRHVKAKGGT